MMSTAAEREADTGYGATPQPPSNEPVAGANPYDPEVADTVPPWGQAGAKTSGALTGPDGEVVEVNSDGSQTFKSGVKGNPISRIDVDTPRPYLDGNLMSHVETNAVLAMREQGLTDGTLYINRELCTAGSAGGCAGNIANVVKQYLPPGSTLTIYGPSGLVGVFTS